jgi:LacI family transcriptional regulator
VRRRTPTTSSTSGPGSPTACHGTCPTRRGSDTWATTWRAAGAAVDPALVRLGSHDAVQAEAVVRELLALPSGQRPTALFCGNNRHTVGALHALRGLEHEVALVGFDDFELADLLGTTVIRHDSQDLGLHAAALAFGRLNGMNGPPQRVIVETRLVTRGSGEVAPR